MLLLRATLLIVFPWAAIYSTAFLLQLTNWKNVTKTVFAQVSAASVEAGSSSKTLIRELTCSTANIKMPFFPFALTLAVSHKSHSSPCLHTN